MNTTDRQNGFKAELTALLLKYNAYIELIDRYDWATIEVLFNAQYEANSFDQIDEFSCINLGSSIFAGPNGLTESQP